MFFLDCSSLLGVAGKGSQRLCGGRFAKGVGLYKFYLNKRLRGAQGLFGVFLLELVG